MGQRLHLVPDRSQRHDDGAGEVHVVFDHQHSRHAHHDGSIVASSERPRADLQQTSPSTRTATNQVPPRRWNLLATCPGEQPSSVIVTNAALVGRRRSLALFEGTKPWRRLGKAPGDRASPAWSPDGTQIASVVIQTRNPDIHVIKADGSEEHPW